MSVWPDPSRARASELGRTPRRGIYRLNVGQELVLGALVATERRGGPWLTVPEVRSLARVETTDRARQALGRLAGLGLATDRLAPQRYGQSGSPRVWAVTLEGVRDWEARVAAVGVLPDLREQVIPIEGETK